ncbi:hypothetical protein ACWGCW_07185 [Streptomyces sp. NPDC054933]
MKKLMRRIATASISAALAGGALLASGGSAAASTPLDGGRTPARAVVTADAKAVGPHGVRHDHGDHVPGHPFRGRADHEYGNWRVGYAHTVTYQGAKHRLDPWVADQLLMFDPWVEDQLAMFVHPGDLGHWYTVNDWHRSLHEHSDHSGEGPHR